MGIWALLFFVWFPNKARFGTPTGAGFIGTTGAAVTGCINPLEAKSRKNYGFIGITIGDLSGPPETTKGPCSPSNFQTIVCALQIRAIFEELTMVREANISHSNTGG